MTEHHIIDLPPYLEKLELKITDLQNNAYHWWNNQFYIKVLIMFMKVEGKAKKSPTNFSFYFSQTLESWILEWILVLTLLSHCCKFHATPSVGPKLLNFDEDYQSRKSFFWSNLDKIEVTLFIEMLELPNFDHMAKDSISFYLRDKLWRHKLYYKIFLF